MRSINMINNQKSLTPKNFVWIEKNKVVLIILIQHHHAQNEYQCVF